MANYHSAFVVFDDLVKDIFGASPSLELLHENAEYPIAREAGVFVQEDNSLFITSNQFTDPRTNLVVFKSPASCSLTTEAMFNAKRLTQNMCPWPMGV